MISEDFILCAARSYRKKCVSTKSFLSDLAHLDINADIIRYKNSRELRSLRVLINRIVVACNLFGPDAIDLLLETTKEDRSAIAKQILSELSLFVGTFVPDEKLKRDLNETFKRTTE